MKEQHIALQMLKLYLLTIVEPFERFAPDAA